MAAWLALVRWRTARVQHALWKSLVLPASGVALSWLLLLTLGLPVIDYARSYRPWVYLVAQHVPNGVCVAAQLPRSALAALENYSNWRIDAQGDVARTSECPYLLVDENRHAPVVGAAGLDAGGAPAPAVGARRVDRGVQEGRTRPRRGRPTSGASRSRAEAPARSRARDAAARLAARDRAIPLQSSMCSMPCALSNSRRSNISCRRSGECPVHSRHLAHDAQRRRAIDRTSSDCPRTSCS